MKRTLLTVTILGVYAAHQDFWYWRDVKPLVFGFMPIGLFYHACFSVVASVLMLILVKFAWPDNLE